MDINELKDENLKRTVHFAIFNLFLGQGLNDENSEKVRINKKSRKWMINFINTFQLSETLLSLKSIYFNARVCPYEKSDCDLDTEGLPLEPKIKQIFMKSKNYDKLSYYWKAWRNSTGAKMKEFYKYAVKLTNEGLLGISNKK